MIWNTTQEGQTNETPESAYLFQRGSDSFGLVLVLALVLFVGHLEDILLLLNPRFVLPHDLRPEGTVSMT